MNPPTATPATSSIAEPERLAERRAAALRIGRGPVHAAP